MNSSNKKEKFKYKKKYGQNFIFDKNILKKIVSIADINDKTLVIEIGVGAGTLTSELLNKSKFLLGYEIDNELKETIDENLKEYNNYNIIYDDFLKRNLSLDTKKIKHENVVVVGNLPYYITTPIIEKIINDKIEPKQMVFMVQKEVANRFAAKINTKDYGSITVFLNYYFTIKKEFTVSKNVFFPIPKVDSAILSFKSKEKNMHVKNEKIFFKLVRDAFKQKRKNLRNNLKGYDLDKINQELLKHNKSLNCRAENITLEEFIKISNIINN